MENGIGKHDAELADGEIYDLRNVCADEGTSLTPPPNFFRVVQGLYQTETSGEWLCLPRQLFTTAAVTEEDDDPEGGSTTTSLITSTKSSIKAQLVIVKMRSQIKALRNERDALELLHDKDGSESFIGCWVSSEVLFSTPANSYLCLRPIYGKSLDAFGAACVTSTRIPGYFVWHIFLSLLDAISFVHATGLAHGSLCAANVVLRCEVPRKALRYGDYPDVVLTGFCAAMGVDEQGMKEDTDGLVNIMYEGVIVQWSDTGALMRFVDFGEEQTDPLMRLAGALKGMVDGRMGVKLEELKKEWEDIAVAERAKGPDQCPEWIKKTAYDGLVTDEELEKVARPPLVLKFGKDSQKFKDWARATRTPVALKKRTKASQEASMLVFKFRDQVNREGLTELEEPTWIA